MQINNKQKMDSSHKPTQFNASCSACEKFESHQDWPACNSCHSSATKNWPVAVGVGLLTAGVYGYVASLSYWGIAAVGMFFASLAVLALYDARTMLLPDKLTLPLLWAGLVFNSMGGFVPLHLAVLGAVFGYLSLWTLFWCVALTTGKIGIGYGDFKLLAAIGAWLGYAPLTNVLLVASITSLVFLSVQKLRGKGDFSSPFAFGPYIALGGVVITFMQ
jgi:prepilin signal peptidase PulO-like enzyme (type II secretory pathway)